MCLLLASAAFGHTLATPDAQIYPLHYAVAKGLEKTVGYLLSHGAQVNGVDSDGDTPLHYADMRPNRNITIMLLKDGAHVDAPNAIGLAPLHAAAYAGNIDCIEELLVYKATIDAPEPVGNMTALYCAIFQKKREAAKLLLLCGARVDWRNNSGDSPLHYIAHYGNADLAKFLARIETINRAATINAQNNAGETPLHTAIKHGRSDVVQVLVQYGTRHDIRDAAGRLASELSPH